MTHPDTRQLPDLPLSDDTGRETRLGDHLTADDTVLFFLRASTCPVCVGHARKLAAAHARGRLAAPVVLVVPGDARDAATVARRIGQDGSGVTVLASDEAHALAGLPRQMLMQHSGTFVVGPDRQIRYARTALLPTGAYDERELLTALDRTRPGVA